MEIEVSFSDFSSESNYLNLQNKFILQDAKNMFSENLVSILNEDFPIVFRTIDDDNREDYQTIYFQKDFLVERINILAGNYIKIFTHKLETDFLYKTDEKEKYISVCYKKISDFVTIIPLLHYLSEEIKIMITEQASLVLDYIHQTYLKPNHIESDKIKTNLSQTELLLLMLLLSKRKIINPDHDSRFGHLLEKTFLVTNSQGQYVQINNAGKHINDYKNFNKTTDTAMARLKAIFQEDAFFNLEI
ncbi:hypothetical protein G4D82_04880 [Flavobacterium sp. CYK-4]|uniref:hypothetical protein n=1 Tax=Flavobacterium lotistagni TaxID=2709660 RepID=UPI0014074F5A|nr:hypothetical protein [Flavobacterium lotistagni]NHM06546.1 hypothetical protein [Flavobacterium lotistagni]